MIYIRNTIFALWIACISVPVWFDFRTAEGASTITSATGLGISPTGKFTIAGTETFLLGISYFDGLRWRTSDIDTLAARGFNNLRIFVNWADDLYGNARSVCNTSGAIKATEAATVNALIDYAEAKNMTVDIVILTGISDISQGTETARLACVTSAVNAFKSHPLVMFDVLQEFDYAFYGLGSPPPYPFTAAQVKLYTDQAKIACPTCIIFASATQPYIQEVDSGTDFNLSAINTLATADGLSAIAVHEYRSENWWSVTGARVAVIKSYLASIGKTNVAVIFDEPNRHGGDWNSTEAQFNTAAASAEASGAAMWVFHHSASFDMSASSLFAQLNATETAITLSMAASLSGSRRSPVSLSSQHSE